MQINPIIHNRILTIEGTRKVDNIDIIQKDNQELQIITDEGSFSFDSTQFDSILVTGKAGNDMITFTDYRESDSDKDLAYRVDLFGGSGDDNLSVNGKAKTYLYGGMGNDTLKGGQLNDIIRGGGGDDRIYGASGDDILIGGDGQDKLYGLDGNDLIFAGWGDDFILGGTGNDILYGGLDNDILKGGPGNDRLFGGDGVDIFSGGPGQDKMKIHEDDSHVDDQE